MQLSLLLMLIVVLMMVHSGVIILQVVVDSKEVIQQKMHLMALQLVQIPLDHQVHKLHKLLHLLVEYHIPLQWRFGLG